jgi:hypothetical protein
MARIEGGCLCRKVCHSADASRSSSACATAPTASASPAPRSRRWSPVPAPALKVTGTLKTFTNPGDTGRPMPRRFCPECDSGVVDGRAGSVCVNRLSGLIGGASAGFRPPRSAAAG